MSVHDRWGKGVKGQGQRWEVRYRELGRQHKRRFDTKAQAEAFDARRRVEPATRTQEAARAYTVADLMAAWLNTKTDVKPKTLDAYRADVREVVTAFGDRLAAQLKPSEVRAWAARDRGVSLRRRSLVALRQAYKYAVADGWFTTDPTVGIPLPKAHAEEQRFLSWDELSALAAESGRFGPLVWLLGTCGLRIGEAVGLRGSDVDRRRNRIRVQRAVVSTSRGQVVGTTKSGKSRDVPVPSFVLAMLPVTDGWLFTGVQGDRLNVHYWRDKVFKPAAQRAGLGDLHPHSLRHTAASMAIHDGADAGAVQRMLGHSSAVITMDVYRHLFDSSLDDVAARMDKRFAERP